MGCYRSFPSVTPSITNREYRKLRGVGWDTAHRVLSELVRKGILKREGKGRATHYRMIIG
jgi:predicted HTH transcriptional regulator